MEYKQELYQVMCLAGGTAVILFSMVHFVVLPTFRIYESVPELEISWSLPRTYLLHELTSVSQSHTATVTEADVALGE